MQGEKFMMWTWDFALDAPTYMEQIIKATKFFPYAKEDAFFLLDILTLCIVSL